ncbi:MAG: Phytoene synthase [uncultured Chloroflexia bacterium]|uniref:Phytoene synthase n=1 Tax=uncultured Chloroflexia bacterium TaxID=1672391 RepID=A0A6J4JZ40_9CHLR|nr:MAG: Phytoene synthase [uncultured Chloroflexia bacterium]
MMREQSEQLLPGCPPDAIRVCAEVTRRHANTFYFGSRFLDASRRAAVWAVYAACRRGDDVVDEPAAGTADQRRDGLEDWWRNVEAAYAGRPANDPVWIALAWAVATYPIPLHAFEELYQGLRMDLDGAMPATLADLELYCRRVGGVIGFMVTPICGYRGGEETLACALRLGQAMQLTNVLRDVGEDLALDRVYLPADYLARHNVRRAALERGEITPEYRALVQELVAIARAWYCEARPGIAYLEGPARLAIAVAARAYEGILAELERNDYDNLSRRAFVTSRRKVALVPATLWQLYTSRPPSQAPVVARRCLPQSVLLLLRGTVMTQRDVD